MASSSSSFLSKRQKNYHVFLSFRGTDVRNNFLGHLYHALDSKGINAYKDDQKLHKGEEITPALMEAIWGSHLAVVVLSENYAESAFCLRELTRVMECKELKEIVVLPVFYKVEPREVRGQRESYGRAMAQHEEKLGFGSEEVAKWRAAVISVGKLSGWHIQDGDEAELVRSIVNEVSSHLKRPPLHVAKFPVGLDDRVESVTLKLEMQFKDVSMVGIWGTGGVGKTTIAKAVYNYLSNSFVDRCFIGDVRERSSNTDGMVKLQQQLLSEVLREKEFPIFSVAEGIELIKDRLCCKKILLVLDDVDKLEKLDALAGRCDWFGKGSQIIITTRDKHLLTCHGLDKDAIFTAEELCHKEALELFCSHAFRLNERKDIGEDLVSRVLAKGLPLALVVLGSFLCGRSELEWQSAIKRLEKIPDKTINSLLKISFDGLDENEKEIFLDIACFLKGNDSRYVTSVLDSSGYDTTLGLELLKERCLIQSTSEMHDLLQLMGKDIVLHQNPDNPGMRSRLWLYDDVVEVLSGNQGTNAITGIMLKLSEPEDLYVSPDAFKNMRRLRLLILHNVNLHGGPIRLPDNVQCLELHNCSIPNLEFSAGSKKLVTLDMQNNSITRFESRCANFRYLKTAKFAGCRFLVLIPDLSMAPNLQTLDLQNCWSLMKVDQSVGRLEKLVHLNLKGCSALTVFPDELKSEELQTLDFTDCSKLKKFPGIVARMLWLYEVYLQGSGIEELPSSIENLIAVETFNLEGCRNLTSIPNSIYKLQTLETLILKGCHRLRKFPGVIEDPMDPETSYGCPKLRHLDLSGCSLGDAEFLNNVKCFPGIESLKLLGNKIPTLHLHDRRNFDFSQFEGCQNMREISISGNKRLAEEFIDHLHPPEVVDVVLSATRIPLSMKRGLSCQNRGREFSSSFCLTARQLIGASTLALGFIISLKDRNLLDVDVSSRITVEIWGKSTYSYTKDFPSLKSDITWLHLLAINEMVDDTVLRQTKQVQIFVSLHLSTCSVELKEFGFKVLHRINSNRRGLRTWENPMEYGDESVETNHLSVIERADRGEDVRSILWNDDSNNFGSDTEASSELAYEEGPGECSRANYFHGDSDSSYEDFGGNPGDMEGTEQDPTSNDYDSEFQQDSEGYEPERSTSATEQNICTSAPTSNAIRGNTRKRVGLKWLLVVVLTLACALLILSSSFITCFFFLLWHGQKRARLDLGGRNSACLGRPS